MRIAIVGGGLTGLTAAYRLSKEGHEIVLFEGNSELGGLASGLKIEGNSIEKTYHHIFKTDIDIIELVKELGLEEKLKWFESSVAIYYDGQIYPFKTPGDLLRFKPLKFLNRLRAGLVTFYLQKKKKWAKFETQTAYDWMRRKSGEQVTKVIWEPLLRGKFQDYFDKVSMAWLWARIHTRANSRKGLGKELLGYFEGGFEIISNKLEEGIKANGGIIWTSTRIDKCHNISEDKVLLQFVDNNEIVAEVFDKAIFTVPNHIFSTICDLNTDTEKEIDYIGAVCAVFSSSQDLSQFYWHNINDLNSPFLVFLDHTRLTPKEWYQGQSIYYIGAYVPHTHIYFSQTDDEIFKIWFEQVKKLFPDFSEELIREKYLFRLKYAQHIVTTNYSQKKPDYKTSLNNVYLANFSQIYPEDRGTNFAVREGNKIADLVK